MPEYTLPEPLVTIPHGAPPNDIRRTVMAMYVHRVRHERVGAALRVLATRSPNCTAKHKTDARAILDGPGDLLWSNRVDLPVD